MLVSVLEREEGGEVGERGGERMGDVRKGGGLIGGAGRDRDEGVEVGIVGVSLG